MIALFAGTGDVPALLARRLRDSDEQAVICQMAGFPAADPDGYPVLTYRLEHLGSVLVDLRDRGVTHVCLAGAVRRPAIDPAAIDAATLPLINRLSGAMLRGDDGTLREVLAILEEAGFMVLSASEIAPDLLPVAGVPTRARPTPAQEIDALRAEAIHHAMALADVGQACVVRAGQALAIEAGPGTDAMLHGLDPAWATGGLFFKAPKPGQDRRVDLPVIGPQTARLAAQAGLTALVVEAGGVMVLDLPQVVALCDAQGMALWIRPAS